MKRTNIILICIIIALVSGIVGFIIGMSVSGNNIINLNSVSENDIIGTYKANTLEKELVLVLQKDKTIIHPMGYNGTWLIDNEKVYIEFDYIDTIAKSVDEYVAEFSEGNNKMPEKNYMKHEKQEIILVEGGLMLNGQFFEKVKNK